MDSLAKFNIDLWRNREKDKDFLLSDAPSISFVNFNLPLSIAPGKRVVHCTSGLGKRLYSEKIFN